VEAPKLVTKALGTALDALRENDAYLREAGVFDAELIEQWIAGRHAEIEEIRQRPHPHEFTLYFNA
jgi:glutamine synthetase